MNSGSSTVYGGAYRPVSSPLNGVLDAVDTSQRDTLQCLILYPCRGSAYEIRRAILPRGDEEFIIKFHACDRGMHLREDLDQLELGQTIVSGTPINISDYLRHNQLATEAIKTLILYQPDEMLARGFKKPISDVYQHLPFLTQVVLVSSNFPREMLMVTKSLMSNHHVRVFKQRTEFTLQEVFIPGYTEMYFTSFQAAFQIATYLLAKLFKKVTTLFANGVDGLVNGVGSDLPTQDLQEL